MNLALFDIDGTLLQNTKAHNNAFRHAVGNVYGIDIDNHDMTQYPGWTDRAIITHIAEEYGVPFTFVDDVLHDCISLLEDKFKEDFAKEDLRILPGVKNLLSILKNSAHQGVVTGNCRNIGYAKLNRAELTDYIKVGAFGSERTVRSELVTLAMSRATEQGLSYKHAIVIGDTPRDVIAGKEAGAKTIAVATGKYSMQELMKTCADAVVPSLEDTDYLISVITEF